MKFNRFKDWAGKIKKHLSFHIVGSATLMFLSLLLLVPLIWVLYSSFKDAYVFRNDHFGLPTEWIFDNYVQSYTAISVKAGQITYNLLGLFINSLYYTLLYDIVPLAGATMVAYGCARYRSIGGKIFHNLVIVSIITPVMGGLSSSLDISRTLGIFDNVLASAVFQMYPRGMAFLVLYSTFVGIDKGYSEAAFIDGAGHWQVFLTIMVPLAKNILGVYLVTGFISYWNDWQTALIWFPSSPTLSYGLYRAQFGQTSIPILFSCCIVAMIPVLLMFIIFREKIIGKLSFGGIKG